MVDLGEREERKTDEHPAVTTPMMDPRLGTVTPGTLCSTCSNPPEVCNGHMVHLTLKTPVVSALFIPLITKIFTTMCISCARILLDLSGTKYTDLCRIPTKKRLTELANRASKVRGPCVHCGCM